LAQEPTLPKRVRTLIAVLVVPAGTGPTLVVVVNVFVVLQLPWFETERGG